MGLMDVLSRVTDPYQRQARLWPALLALLPLIAMVGLLYGPASSSVSNVVTLVLSCGGLYLLASVCRELGRRLEPRLFEEWGGKPTTQLLRHRNSTIESVTKRRYHAFLAAKINSVFPDEKQESQDPKAADEIYQSAVRWLLTQTRDPNQFGLLLQENIAYGFRRNALGLKPYGLLIAFSCAIWVLIKYNVITQSSDYYLSMNALTELPPTVAISLVISVLMLVVWNCHVTKKGAKTSAFTYAEMLLRACDTLH